MLFPATLLVLALAAPAARPAADMSSEPMTPAQQAEADQLIDAGEALAANGRYPEALDAYWQAWDRISEPKSDLPVALQLLAAIGDANFLGRDFQACRDNLASAMHLPDAIGNPFLHLRLGQCQYELGNMERAADELARAYLQEGTAIFANDDPKYLDFIKSKLQPPPGGWPEGW